LRISSSPPPHHQSSFAFTLSHSLSSFPLFVLLCAPPTPHQPHHTPPLYLSSNGFASLFPNASFIHTSHLFIMARFSQQPFDFYQQSPSALESKATFSEEDEMSVLDDKILDSTPDVAMTDPRRSSYDHNAHSLPYREQWTDFQSQVQQHASHPQSRHNSQVAAPMYDSGSNTFMRLDTTHTNSSYGQQTSWPMSRDSGSCTPTPVYDQFSQDFDGNSAGAFSGGAVGPISSINFSQMNYRPGHIFAAPGGVAMSPQSSQGWMTATAEVQDGRPRPTRSPTYRNDSPIHLRRDGIRKKNARFEIPAERTLSNIDQLIAQSTNEDEIKELKQQKRLLRNRQAA
jgi:hypothetical protein